MTDPDNPLVDIIFPLMFGSESESRNANRAISLVQFSPKYPSTCWKWKVGTNPERFGWKKNLRNEIKKGPFKSSPNSFQIINLDDEIWTFEQIDDLRQAPNMITFFVIIWAFSIECLIVYLFYYCQVWAKHKLVPFYLTHKCSTIKIGL